MDGLSSPQVSLKFQLKNKAQNENASVFFIFSNNVWGRTIFFTRNKSNIYIHKYIFYFVMLQVNCARFMDCKLLKFIQMHSSVLDVFKSHESHQYSNCLCLICTVSVIGEFWCMLNIHL